MRLRERVGIVSLLFCGITLKHYAYHNMSHRTQRTTRYMFGTLAQVSSTFPNTNLNHEGRGLDTDTDLVECLSVVVGEFHLYLFGIEFVHYGRTSLQTHVHHRYCRSSPFLPPSSPLLSHSPFS